MIVKKLELTNVFASNIYFYINETTKHGFLIDPGAGTDEILKILRQNNWSIEKILLTHSHLDHLGAAVEISKKCHIPFFGLNTAQKYFGAPDHFTDPNALSQMSYFKSGEKISLSDESATLEVLATPGHTLDSVCFYDHENNILFSGDTLFAQGYGRTDLAGGNSKELLGSLTQLFKLPPQTLVYPGHGLSTTIADENHISFTC